jgi:hypothetical protein
VLGFGYFVFQFVTFTPIRNWADLELSKSLRCRSGPGQQLSEVWTETLLPALGGRSRNLR